MLETYKARVKNEAGMKAEIIEFHEAHVTGNDKAHGNRWYQTANLEAHRIANLTGNRVSVCQVAAVISALSPAVSWEINLRDAQTVCEAYVKGSDFDSVTVSTYGQNKAKAYRILSGGLFIDSVRGHFKAGTKTEAFFLNIYSAQMNDPSPDLHSIVTIDRHAVGIALGSRDTSHQNLSLTAKRYRTIAAAYVAAAEYLGYANPYQLQAATWVAFRREFAG